MNFFRQFFKAFSVAFSIYSKIPVPRFAWKSDDMKYHLCFFPFVGAFIAGLEVLWCIFSVKYRLNELFFSTFAICIPVLITGGFHLDGFMDTMDALHSYGDRAKKLEILKDPHIGAFSVINLLVLILLSLGFLPSAEKTALLYVLPFSFVISRCLSGLSVLLFPKAKKDGMALTESLTKSGRTVVIILIIELAAGLGLCFYLALIKGLLIFFAAQTSAVFFCFLYYFFMSKKHFGGITGDLCGFFVCISEFFSLFSVTLASLALRILGD